MNTQTLKKTISFGLSLMLTFMTVLASTALAQNQKSWTTAATAGVVDEGDVDEVNLGTGVMHLNTGTTASAQASIRYNVVATDGLFVAGYPRMRVRFRDGGANAQVVVSLYRINMSTGGNAKVLELDSNDYAGSSSFQTQTTAQCAGSNFGFDFTNNAYYIEVKLIRSASNGLAGLATIQLFNESTTVCNQ
ncbi:MAG: hypothetical protein ACKVZH_17200 [Blastocatellia bacterium]